MSGKRGKRATVAISLATLLLVTCAQPAALYRDIEETVEAARPAELVPPVAPTEVEATPTGTTTIDLTWSDNSDNEEGFQVQRDGGSGFQAIANIGSDSVAYSDTELTAETSYTYRVRAVNSAGDSDWSEEAAATTLATDLYTVTYDGNGSDGGSVPVDTNAYAEGATVTVSDRGSMTLSGYAFIGWNTAADGSGTSYLAGATFEIQTAGVVLYAQWTTDDTFSVTYDGNGFDGGSVPEDANRYREGATVATKQPGTMSRSGATFAGWNTAVDGGGDSYGAGATFEMPANDVTFFAQWELNEGTIAIANPEEAPSLTMSPDTFTLHFNESTTEHTIAVSIEPEVPIASYEWFINGVRRGRDPSITLNAATNEDWFELGVNTLTLVVVVDGETYSGRFFFSCVDSS